VTYLEADAVLSPCGLYRYLLTRTWNPDRGAVAFVMLNPSTADHRADDPTIRRCVAFADAWGYGRLVVVNLFALRATDPSELRRSADPIGPDNDYHIAGQCAGRTVVAAWGGVASKWPHPKWAERARAVRKLIGSTACVEHLGLTADGCPKHPLARGKHRVPDGVKPQPFPPPAGAT